MMLPAAHRHLPGAEPFLIGLSRAPQEFDKYALIWLLTGILYSLAALSRQSLGKGLSIAAVQWGGREVLVGISGTTITFLNDARGEGPPFADTPPALGPAPTTASDGAASESTAALAVALRGAPVAKRSLIEQLREATVRV